MASIVRPSIGFQFGSAFSPTSFGCIPLIQNQPPAAGLEIVRVRADLSVTGEIDELHAAELLLLFLFLLSLILILFIFERSD